MLEQLVRAGADLKAPRHVVYYLYFTDRNHAAAGASEAEARGFATEVREPTPERSDEWALVCERHDYVLDLEAVRVNTDLFEELAAQHSGDYDGWEASVA